MDRTETSATPGLVRGVGVAAMTAVMINAIIGAGIFGLPSRIHGIAGPYGLMAFLGCAIVVAAIGLCFGEVSSRFRETGGPYLYTRHAFGPVVAFVIGWLMWVTRVTAVAAIANVMISYLSVFWPGGGAGLGRSLVIAAAVAAWTAIIASGVRQSAATAVTFTIGKLIPLALFIAVGLFALDTRAFALGAPPEPGRFAEAVLLLIFAFGGFEGVVVLAGESKNPRRDLPLALLGALSVVTLFYVLIQVVCIGTLPNLDESTRPLADAAARFMGGGAFLITAGALISTSGTMFAAMFSGPRVLYAMAEQGQLPAPFGAANARTHTPLLAIAVTSIASLVLAVTGTFTWLATLSAITRVLIYVGTAGALIVLRRRPDVEPAQVRVPGGAWVAALAIAACGWMLASVKAGELRDVGIAIGIGLVLYVAQWASARARPKPATAMSEEA